MMFSCKNLALNMAKSLSFLFFYSTFQYFLVKYINGYYGKDDHYKNFDLSFCYVFFKFYDCTKFHYSQVTGEKSYQQQKFSSLFFDHLNTDEALSSTECLFTCKSAMLERTHHYLL